MSARPLLRSLCQPYTELLERSEAYLAAVDLWASRGNAQTLANAVGSGKINVVAALAAKSIRTPTYPSAHFQASSGLSPSAFNAALDILAAAISVPAASSSNPSTPSRSHSSHLATPGKSGSRDGRSRIRRAPNLDSPVPLVGRASSSSSSSASLASQMSLQERAKAVQSGVAFGMSPSASSRRSPTTPTSARRRPTASNSPRVPSAPSSPSASREKQPSVGFASPSSRPQSSSSTLSTPRSHRRPAAADKTPTTSQQRAAAASASDAISPSSSVKSTPRHQQRHLYTPSKRSRLGPREDENDDDSDADQEEQRAANATSHQKRRRLNGSSTTKQRQQQRKPLPEDDGLDYLASRKLPIALFPLCPLTGSGGGGRHGGKGGSIVAAQRVVDDWLDQWAAWLDNAGAPSDDEEMTEAV